MVKTAIVGLAFASLFLAAAPGWTTTVLEQSFPDLVQKAETIVVGTVSAIATDWDAATETPYTLVTVTDLDIRKGPARETLTVRLLGGPDPDGTTLQVAGMPSFHLGDRVVLFLAGNDHYAVPLVGLWQGMYRVVYDPNRDADVLYTHARQPLTALPARRDGVVYERHSTRVEEPTADPLALDTLLQAIDQEMAHD